MASFYARLLIRKFQRRMVALSKTDSFTVRFFNMKRKGAAFAAPLLNLETTGYTGIGFIAKPIMQAGDAQHIC